MKGRSPDFDDHLIDVVLDWVATTTTHPLAIVAIPGLRPVVTALTHDGRCTCPDATRGRPCWHAVAVAHTLRSTQEGEHARPT
jgi:hypothetical protein